MKIGFALDDTLDKPDGVQQYVILLGRWLSRNGHEVHYLVTYTTRTDIPNVHSLGGYTTGRFNGNSVRTPLPVKRRVIERLLDELQLDVIHVQMPYSPFFVGRIIKASPNVRKVATFHILPYSGWQRATNYLLGFALRSTASQLTTVVAPSPESAAFAASAYGVSTRTIPHPIDIARFRRGTKLPQYDDQLTNILYLGRLDARKGVLALIRSYLCLDAILRDRTRLIIAGYGPQLAQAKSLAGNIKNIIFTGFVPEPEKPNYYASADLAVFPATGGESFGIVLTEAMASGSGVVLGGNNPGYSSVLSPTPECLFDPQSPEPLTQLLTQLVRDPHRRRALHDRQQAMLDRFDIEAYGNTILKLYAD